ncbi:hypothetical protein NAL32_21885 [Chryseobacterium sp. Ch-15]|uniref:Uncharacterized protein n=1 Tax=Chryseobacterium muglaense TaxID=2893752 RepID=A0A9Q3UVD1_9FLAO|nr:hypothetical protein [Chryseobacterium muglaense]MBD3905579.1 hypothetical protein [Chryseobacterium muglaense]MCC9036373.1 hypothetical protein [Chryseobacterium muglaense]MCM2557040.1 hypothetical protein [Chryseobacterium muglaense]
MQNLNKTLTVRKVDWKIFLINLVTVCIPLYFIVLLGSEIHDSTIQTFFIIASLSVLGLINFMIVKKGSKIVKIFIDDSAIEIKENDKIIYSAKYSDITNYNVYNFINKRGGYVVRLKDKKSSFCSLLTWNSFSKANETDYQYKEEIINTLQINLSNKKKTTFTDYAVKLFSALPYIMLVIAVVMLIGILIYLSSI